MTAGYCQGSLLPQGRRCPPKRTDSSQRRRHYTGVSRFRCELTEAQQVDDIGRCEEAHAPRHEDRRPRAPRTPNLRQRPA
eukprot:507291-Prorocentrum_minimum.AAC.1